MTIFSTDRLNALGSVAALPGLRRVSVGVLRPALPDRAAPAGSLHSSNAGNLMSRFRFSSCLLVLGLWLGGPAALAQDHGATPPATVVDVVTLTAEDVTLTMDLPGRVVALGVAEVRPQVTGLIAEMLFREGSLVQEGDPMYQIEPGPYEARVARSEAVVAQARAALEVAEKDVTRYQELIARKVISQQDLDNALSTRDVASAELDSALAQLRTDRIDLENTVIRAPLTGMVGRALTTKGALVTAQQTDALAVIRQIDEVFVDATVSAAEGVRRQRAALRKGEDLRDRAPVVSLTLTDGEPYEHIGILRAGDFQVDPETGVTLVRIAFPNPDQLLLPGLYVQAHLPMETITGAVLAPQRGVARDRRGQPTALVVGADNTVELRQLVVQGTQGNTWIVTEGLSAGDRLIVGGLQRIRPGVPVTPREEMPVASAQADPAADPAAGTPAH